MKKTVRTNAKRTLSVFMAALMLLTAWVFVAPQKAEAITSQTAGKYKVAFCIYDSGNGCENIDKVTITYKTSPNNARGTQVSSSTYVLNNSGDPKSTLKSGGSYYIKNVDNIDFPTEIYYYAHQGSFAGSDICARVLVAKAGTANYTKNASGWTDIVSEYKFLSATTDGLFHSSDSGSKTFSGSDIKNKPSLNSVGISGSTTVHAKSDDSTTATYTVTSAKDQYGVDWGFTGVSWASNHNKATINSSGVATFNHNDYSDYSVTFTPTIKHSTHGDKTSPNTITVSVITAKKLDVNGYIYTVAKDSGENDGGLGGKAKATIKIAGSTHTSGNAVDDFYEYIDYNNSYEISVKPIAGWKMAGVKEATNSNYTLATNTDAEVKVTGNMPDTAYAFRFAVRPKVIKLTLNKDYTAEAGTSGNIAGTTEIYYKFDQSAAQDTSNASITGTYFTSGSNSNNTLIGKVTSITKPKRTGYTFDGYWSGTNGTGTQYIKADGTFINNAYKTFASDTTLYAKWVPINVNVKYINNDGTVLKESSAGKYDKKAGDTDAAAPANPEFVYTPGVSHGTFDYVFSGDWQIVEAKKLTTAGSTDQVNDYAAVGSLYSTTQLKGDTVFQPIYNVVKNNYSITYMNGTTPGSTKSDYTYRDNGKSGDYATATYPASDAEGKTWTYEFLGWAEQVNTGDTVYYQDWDADLGAYVPQDNAQTPLTDTKVYHDATWVAVYGRKYIDYKVTFNFVGVTTDETGATTYNAGKQEVITKHYDETIQIPEALSYTGGKLSGTAPAGANYGNSTGYTYNFNAWSPALSGAEIAVAAISGWSGSANAKTKTFQATYTDVPATYHIYFVAPDTVAGADGIQHAQYSEEDGSLLTKVLNGTTEFSHGASVNNTKNQAEAAVVRTYRDDDNEYTFTGWAPAYTSTATDNVTYTAQYDVTPLYTVIYADENGELGSWKGTTSEYIPLTIDGMGTPVKEDDLYATDYTFSGWATTEYDAKNPVNPAINLDGTRKMLMPENGTTVYAQFTRTPITYTINFIYGTPVDGVMPDHKQELEYGEDVVIPTGDTLNRADDEKYHYTFSSWDNIPSATVTGNATYTASYRKSYVYYDVTWLYQNGAQPDGKDFRVEKYIYDESIRAPLSTPGIITEDPDEDPLLPPLPDNTWTYAFDQWILAEWDDVNNKWVPQYNSGNVIPFDAGTHIEPRVNYTYLPTYKAVADLKTLTILDEDGTTVLGTMDIGIGETILDYVDNPEAKNPDDDYHYAFDKWVYVADDTETDPHTAGDDVLDTDTMTGNISIKATFTPVVHTYEFFETKTAPTYDAAGVVTLVCEADGCGHTEDVELPALSDSELPTVRLYVKNTHWDSTVPPALTALDNTVIPIAPNSLLIANSADDAEASVYYVDKTTLAVTTTEPADNYETVTYNTDGVGSQVNEIWAYYTEGGTAYTLAGLADVPDATDENPDGWHQIFQRSYDDETGKWGTEEANHSDTFASFEPAIEDGHQYVVYLKAIDAKGNINYISSAKLGYDTTAPEVTLTSDNGANAAATKFCLDTTIVTTEVGLTAVLDGEAITLTAVSVTDEDENTITTYEYTLNTVGKHTIRVTDAAGNETMKAFEIVGAHNPVTTYKTKTCTEDGWKKDICSLCGKTIGEVEIDETDGHNYVVKTKNATCTADGYTQEVCSKCGDKKDPVAVPALGHSWDAGKINKAANCTQNGIITYTCTRCGLPETITGDSLDVTVTGYDAATAAEILAKHPDLAITTDVETTDPETGDPIITKEPVQAIDTFGNPAFVQKTVDGEPVFTDTVATDEDGNTIYNADGTPAYLPDYTDTPIYSYTIVHNYNSHGFKADKQTTDPTCTEKGEITKQCRYCGLKFHVSDVDPRGHDFTADEADASKWTVGQAATCETAGYKYPSVCAVCGEPNTEKVNQVAIPALVHRYDILDEEKSVAPQKNAENQYVLLEEQVFIGTYYIDDDGNIIDDEHKVGEMKTVYGYNYYICSNDPHHIQVEAVEPEMEYTYTFKVDGVQVGTTLTKHPGEQITLADVPADPTKASTNTTRYIFEGWFDGETEAVFPMIISQETGNKTFTAKFREETIYYTVTFYEEDGTTVYATSGFKTYEQEFTQAGPEKAPDATYDYTFAGWVALDAGADATPITTIKVLGDASYKAKYTATERQYSVAWVIDGAAVKVELEVTSGTTLQQLYNGYDAESAIKNPTKASDATYHYTFDHWDPALNTVVSGNMQVVAKFTKEAHTYDDGEVMQAATCEHGQITKYTCTECGYYYTRTTSSASQHNWVEVSGSRVLPTEAADGYKIMRCTICGTEKQETLPRIYLKVTVQDSNHNRVSGKTVYVYDGNTLVNTGVSGSDGVATIFVPEAKTYRIVIDGNEGSITVNENGTVTNSNIPMANGTPSSGGNSGCDCTCHKSGFWPIIFRFFHKIIKMLTGEFRCCPDANY